MDIGMFMEFASRAGATEHEAFRSGFDQVTAAEAWGLDGVWLAELHFSHARSVLSEPMVVASAIAARTTRLRIGIAVQVLPLNHPLRIAEEAATLDQISEGRLDFGIGRSGAPRSYDIYEVPYGQSQARFSEALDVILEAWKGDAFSHRGEFYRFDDVTISPRPYQQPHPPLKMAAASAKTFPLVGRLGLPIFVGLRGLELPQLPPLLQEYRRAWREAGHPGEGDVSLRIPIYLAPSRAGAIEEPRESTMTVMTRQAGIARARAGRKGAGPIDELEAEAQRLESLSYDEILRTKVAFGTSAEVVDRLIELRDELGLASIVAELNAGGLIPQDRVMRSLRLLTHEVIPALR